MLGLHDTDLAWTCPLQLGVSRRFFDVEQVEFSGQPWTTSPEFMDHSCRLSEVFHQHQIVDGGIPPCVENRTTIGRNRKKWHDVTEVRSHSRRPSSGEVEELESCLTHGPADVVDALFQDSEGRSNDSIQQLHW